MTEYGIEYYKQKHVVKNDSLNGIDDYIQLKFGINKTILNGYMANIQNDKTVEVSKNGALITSGFLENGRIIWEEEWRAKGNWRQNGIIVTNGEITLKVGTAITGYEANGIGDGNWSILGAENGSLLIMMNKNVENITLQGKNGYTNGIKTLNEAAEVYTNDNYAKGKARAVKVEDINRVTGYVDNYVDSYTPTTQFGNEVTYTMLGGKVCYQGTKYPLERIESGYNSFVYWTGNEWKLLEEGKSVVFRNTAYLYYPQTLTQQKGSGENINGKPESGEAYKLLFKGKVIADNYWVASQNVDTYEGRVFFNFYSVGSGAIGIANLYSSWDEPNNCTNGLRVVVSLKTDIKVSVEEEVDSTGKLLVKIF